MGVIKGDTRSLDYSSYRNFEFKIVGLPWNVGLKIGSRMHAPS